MPRPIPLAALGRNMTPRIAAAVGEQTARRAVGLAKKKDRKWTTKRRK